MRQNLGDGRVEGPVSEVGDRSEAITYATQALALRREIGHKDGTADSLIQLAGIHCRAGAADDALGALTEVVSLLRQQQLQGGLARALALRACLPGGDAAAAEAALEEAGEAGNRPQTRYDLWKATRKPEHLQEAKRLLDYRVEHAPEEHRESMLKNVRLNRAIMEAWAEHGEKAAGDVDAR